MSDSHLLNTNNIVNLDTYLASNYVTQDTAQTITGTKTFDNGAFIKLKYSGPELGQRFYHSSEVTSNTVTPTNGSVRVVYFLANDESLTGYMVNSVGTNGSNTTNITAIKKVNGTAKYAQLAVGVNSEGSLFTSAPAPTTTTSTTSDQMATTGWVNTVGNNVVHLSGTETITGSKTYTANYLEFKNTGLATNADAPASGEMNRGFFCSANDGSAFGSVSIGQLPTYNRVLLSVSKNISGTQHVEYAGLVMLDNGTTYMTVPTPSSATSNTTHVATTGWVNTANKTGYGIGAPNYAAYQQITLNASNQYTATENGWILAEVNSGSKVTISNIVPAYSSQGQTATVFPIAKGQTMTVVGSGKFFFIPCMG